MESLLARNSSVSPVKTVMNLFVNVPHLAMFHRIFITRKQIVVKDLVFGGFQFQCFLANRKELVSIFSFARLLVLF